VAAAPQVGLPRLAAELQLAAALRLAAILRYHRHLARAESRCHQTQHRQLHHRGFRRYPAFRV
ncbi:MAG: hypothetical protein RQ736_07250, partial [Thiogranum sp.]|nr:hypothetical protein [Thiogranum sp.]